MARNQDESRNDQASRDRYRDNDDVRAPLEDDEKTGGSADTKSEARGDARENIGNTSRGTDTDIRGSDENDKTRQRPHRDQYDDDLDRRGS
jgi:hypothetical protein